MRRDEFKRDLKRETAIRIQGQIEIEKQVSKVEALEETLEHERCDPWDEDIVEAVTSRWIDRLGPRYKKVKVLLVRWISDDLGVQSELDALGKVFSEMFRYEVAQFQIPDFRPFTHLSKRVTHFIGSNAADTLLIFYCGGHGGIGDMQNELTWAATSMVGSPSMASHGIQAIFEESQSDAILFYDACESAETAVTAASSDPRGVTELISAYGFQTTTPGPCSDSFAFALTKQLQKVASLGHAVPLSEVYSRILADLRNAPMRGQKTTPVHTSLTWTQDGRSILLKPLQESPAVDVVEFTWASTTFALFLRFDDDITDIEEIEAWNKWILRAPPEVAQVYFEHPEANREPDDYKDLGGSCETLRRMI